MHAPRSDRGLGRAQRPGRAGAHHPRLRAAGADRPGRLPDRRSRPASPRSRAPTPAGRACATSTSRTRSCSPRPAPARPGTVSTARGRADRWPPTAARTLAALRRRRRRSAGVHRRASASGCSPASPSGRPASSSLPSTRASGRRRSRPPPLPAELAGPACGPGRRRRGRSRRPRCRPRPGRRGRPAAPQRVRDLSAGARRARRSRWPGSWSAAIVGRQARDAPGHRRPRSRSHPRRGPLTAASDRGQRRPRAVAWCERLRGRDRRRAGRAARVGHDRVHPGRRPRRAVGPGRRDVPGPVAEPFSEVAAELGVHLVLGTYERGPAARRRLQRRRAHRPGRRRCSASYRKTHPFGAERADRRRLGHPRRRRAASSRRRSARSALIICFDGDYPELARITAVRGAEIICRPSALLRSADLWELTNRARAYDNHVYVVGANATGADPGRGHLLRQLDDRHPDRRGRRPGRLARVLGVAPGWTRRRRCRR